MAERPVMATVEEDRDIKLCICFFIDGSINFTQVSDALEYIREVMKHHIPRATPCYYNMRLSNRPSIIALLSAVNLNGVNLFDHPVTHDEINRLFIYTPIKSRINYRVSA